MISKQQAKFVKSLKLKKYRNKAASFLVEGAKNVIELLSSDFQVQHLYVTDRFIDEYPQYATTPHILCKEKELVSMGTFQSNEYALAVAGMQTRHIDMSKVSFALALDNVSDPGNLGTIIRIADWYGISVILAGTGTADFYNPKVINSSMGSFARIQMHYVDLNRYFEENSTFNVLGATLHGKDVHQVKRKENSILLMGSESLGISDSLIAHIDQQITIPRIGKAESLNVAVSTAVICDALLHR